MSGRDQNLTGPAKPLVKRASLKKNFSWVFVGNMVNALSLWGVVMVIAKFRDAETLGVYALGLAWALPIFILALVPRSVLYTTDSKRLYRFRQFFHIRIAALLIALTVLSTGAACLGYDQETYLVILAVGFMKAVDGINDLVQAQYVRAEQMRHGGIGFTIRGTVTFLSFLLLIQQEWGLFSILCVVIGLRILVLLLYDVSRLKRVIEIDLRQLSEDKNRNASEALTITPSSSRSAIITLLILSIPVSISMLFVSLQSSLPRLVLEMARNKESLGYFAAIMYPVQFSSQIASALAQSVIPRLSRLYIEDIRGYSLLVGKLIVIGVTLTCMGMVLAWLIGRWVLELLYGTDYQNFHGELILVAVGNVPWFLVFLMNAALFAGHHFRLQLFAAFLGFAAAAISAPLLIPDGGVRGATFVFLLSAGTMCLAEVFFVWRISFHRRQQSQALT